MNKLFKTLFTLLLGILIFIPTFTANSAEVETSGYSKEVSAKLEEIKYLHESGFISKDEFTKAKEIILKEKKENKELASLKENKTQKKKVLIFGAPSKKSKSKINLFKKKEKEKVSIEDLDELGVYVELKKDQYPEQMYLIIKKNCGKGIRCMSLKAGKYLGKAFSRGEKYQQRHPANLMKAMAMYEIFYLGKLKKKQRNLERYKENWPKDYGNQKRIDEAAIRSLKSINKGRKGMREALGMNLETSIEDAIKRFWVLGEFLGLGQPKKLAKVDSELKKRKKLVNDYKLQITNLRKKLEEDEEKKEIN